MKAKKTSTISFKTTEEIRKKLEKEASEKEWSLSQMVEKIVKEYYLSKKNRENFT